MTRKRYIKLMMSHGVSRNEARANAKEIIAEGISYQESYEEDSILYHLTPEQISIATKAMSDAIKAITEAVNAMLPSLAQIVKRVGEVLIEWGNSVNNEVSE